MVRMIKLGTGIILFGLSFYIPDLLNITNEITSLLLMIGFIIISLAFMISAFID